MNCQLRDNVTTLENLKNGQRPKNKKMWNLVLSKPENLDLRRKTAIEKKFESTERRSLLSLMILSYKLTKLRKI